MVNNFEFPGGTICDAAPPPNTTDETEEPAPTEAPTEDPGGSG